MLHEYHAHMIIRERDRHLRQVSEMARLHRDAQPPKARRPFWARVRRRPVDVRPPPVDARPRPAPRPAYPR